MKNLKCILVDDEPRNLDLLTYYIEKYCTHTDIVGAFSEKKAALEYLED